MNGKSWYIWKIKEIHGGIPGNIVLQCKMQGITEVYIKIVDGVNRYNLRPLVDINGVVIGYVDDILGPLVDALHAAGIRVYGWAYTYGRSPETEAKLGAERTLQFKLDGFVIDAEAEYKAAGMNLAATAYINTLRAQLPNLPIGLATYRYPSYHLDFPWAAFIGSGKLDFHMPQVYWVKSTNPAYQLEKCVNEYRALEVKYGVKALPIIPIGAAYREFLPDGSWQPTPAQIVEFHDKVVSMGLPGESFWEWGSAIRYGFESVVGGLSFKAPPAEKTLEERVAELERKAAELAAKDSQIEATLVEVLEIAGGRLDVMEKSLTELLSRFEMLGVAVDGHTVDIAAKQARIEELAVEVSDAHWQNSQTAINLGNFVQQFKDWLGKF